MKNALELANRFREIMLNGTWVANTNYKHQLTNLDWQLVTTKIGTLNTIADLTQHIHYYIAGINNVFKGGSLDIRDKYSFDFPPITAQSDWDNFLTQFWADIILFADLVEQMPDTQLDAAFFNAQYGNYRRNIDAMIEHSYYHLGQIVLIKNLLSNKILTL